MSHLALKETMIRDLAKTTDHMDLVSPPGNQRPNNNHCNCCFEQTQQGSNWNGNQPCYGPPEPLQGQWRNGPPSGNSQQWNRSMVLRDLVSVVCLCYLGDIVIFARTQEELLERLDRALTRLREVGQAV